MKTVLVVDDEPHVRRVLQMTLQKNGYSVVTAANGKAGLEKVRESMPDAIVLDIEMPQMNGIEMCKAIHDEFPDSICNTFIASSRAEDEFRDWTSEYQTVTFLEKPLSVRSLVSRLEELFPGENQ